MHAKIVKNNIHLHAIAQ